MTAWHCLCDNPWHAHQESTRVCHAFPRKGMMQSPYHGPPYVWSTHTPTRWPSCKGACTNMYQGDACLYTEQVESMKQINHAWDGSLHQQNVSYIDSINPKINGSWQQGDSSSSNPQKCKPVLAANVPKGSMMFHGLPKLYKQYLDLAEIISHSLRSVAFGDQHGFRFFRFYTVIKIGSDYIVSASVKCRETAEAKH